MVRERDPFGMALERLRDELRDGLIGPGEPLVTTDLAATLRISVTPVREALSRLAGEGLIEERRGRGFFALRFGAAEIEELYRLHGAYFRLAEEARFDGGESAEPAAKDHNSAPDREDAPDYRARSERFWTGFVHAGGGEILAQAHQRLTNQLARVRLIEPAVLSDTTQELTEMIMFASDRRGPAFKSAVLAYHQRRQSSARSLAAALQSR